MDGEDVVMGEAAAATLTPIALPVLPQSQISGTRKRRDLPGAMLTNVKELFDTMQHPLFIAARVDDLPEGLWRWEAIHLDMLYELDVIYPPYNDVDIKDKVPGANDLTVFYGEINYHAWPRWRLKMCGRNLQNQKISEITVLDSVNGVPATIKDVKLALERYTGATFLSEHVPDTVEEEAWGYEAVARLRARTNRTYQLVAVMQDPVYTEKPYYHDMPLAADEEDAVDDMDTS